jgi:hypothetical protein
MSSESLFKTTLTCRDYDNDVVTINVKIQSILNSYWCNVSAYDSKLRYFNSHIKLPYNDAIKKISTKPSYSYSELDDGTIVLFIFDTPSSWSIRDEDYALFENNEDEKHIKELDKKISELENQVNELKQLRTKHIVNYPEN